MLLTQGSPKDKKASHKKVPRKEIRTLKEIILPGVERRAGWRGSSGAGAVEQQQANTKIILQKKDGTATGRAEQAGAWEQQKTPDHAQPQKHSQMQKSIARDTSSRTLKAVRRQNAHRQLTAAELKHVTMRTNDLTSEEKKLMHQESTADGHAEKHRSNFRCEIKNTTISL